MCVFVELPLSNTYLFKNFSHRPRMFRPLISHKRQGGKAYADLHVNSDYLPRSHLLNRGQGLGRVRYLGPHVLQWHAAEPIKKQSQSWVCNESPFPSPFSLDRTLAGMNRSVDASAALIVGLFLAIVTIKRYFSAARQPAPYPPGPKGLPLLGNALDFPTQNIAEEYARWSGKYGSRCSSIDLQSWRWSLMSL